MSKGLTPNELVRQVFYCQERVLLDFYPSDDKYKEVLMEANLTIQELQGFEDWTWLRETRNYGVVKDLLKDPHALLSFDLGDDVYKPSTLYGDCVRLYDHLPFPEDEEDFDPLDYIITNHYREVPYTSNGHHSKQDRWQKGPALMLDVPDYDLYAMVVGNKIRFNRPFRPNEMDKVIVIDVQKRMQEYHICDDSCLAIAENKPVNYPGNPCAENFAQTREPLLTEVPDPMYVVVKTASRHADASPSAGGRLATLQDWAQKILSQMRQHNAVATWPDEVDYDGIDYVNVL